MKLLQLFNRYRERGGEEKSTLFSPPSGPARRLFQSQKRGQA